MSLPSALSSFFVGIEALPVRVSAGASPGLPSLTIPGLSDALGRAGRALAAFAGTGLSLLPGRVRVEFAGALADADHHDLPVAFRLLAAMGVLPREELS